MKMKKFAVLTNEEMCIDIVSEETLRHYRSAEGYINEAYGLRNIKGFIELPDEQPAVITIYKEDITEVPSEEEQKKDYKVEYDGLFKVIKEVFAEE